jgi:signal peptidase I
VGVVQSVDEDDAVDPWRRRSRRPRRQMPLWQELPLLLIVAFCLAVLIRTFLLQAFFIPSGSMEDTLLVGDRVLVNKVVYDVRDPARGEVVVFRGTDRWAPQVDGVPEPGFLGKLGQTFGDLVGVTRPGEKDFIKRVIGIPGDRVACCDEQGRVTVNGVGLDEPYVLRDSPLDLPPNPRECRSRRFDEVVVPAGQIFVLGDHRLVSQDARCQGPVPIANVVGRAFLVVWPSSRWASLSVPETFSQVDVVAAAPAPAAPAGPDPVGQVVLLAAGGVVARSGRSMRAGRRRLHS